MVETNEETLKMRDGIVPKMDELLKPSGGTAVYRELHRREGIIARARAKWQKQQSKSGNTSPQKDANEETAECAIGPNSFVNRWVNEMNALPEGRYQCANKAHSKGNSISVSSKSTTTKRVILELEAMKKQEKFGEQLAVKKREAEIRKKLEEMNMRILAEQLEIAKLEEGKERAK